jgi:hypothetical protein
VIEDIEPISWATRHRHGATLAHLWVPVSWRQYLDGVKPKTLCQIDVPLTCLAGSPREHVGGNRYRPEALERTSERAPCTRCANALATRQTHLVGV